MNKTDNVTSKTLEAICAEFGPFSLGWNPLRLEQRLHDIRRFNEQLISSEKGRSIALKARELLDELGETGGLALSTYRDLRDLAVPAVIRRGRGGDRRSGQHSDAVSICRVIVRLYIDAHENPGFTSGRGPLVRFVFDVCDWLGVHRPSSGRIKTAWVGVKEELGDAGASKIDIARLYDA